MIHPRYVIPSIISILGLCVGLSSIKFALNSQFEHAVIAITIASIIDTIDGRIARLIKGTSKFGAELDSLIDFINFGVAPAITVYIWILKDLGNIGWLLVLFHSVACCLRLARFNLGSKMNNEKWRENFFTGVLASAIAAFFYIRVIVLMFFKDPVEDGTSVVIPSALTTITIAVSATVTILLGVFPAPLLNFIETTAFFIR